MTGSMDVQHATKDGVQGARVRFSMATEISSFIDSRDPQVVKKMIQEKGPKMLE